MDPKHYIMLNGLIVILLIASILFIRRGPTPSTRLNLKKAPGRMPQGEGSGGHIGNVDNLAGAESARSLNVVFQHEGNWFDAYEVLGIPAGTSLEQARATFNELLKSVNPERQDIIKEAIKAIAASFQ